MYLEGKCNWTLSASDVYRDQRTSFPLKSLCWAWSVLGPDQRTSADRRSVEKNLLVWSVPGPDQRTSGPEQAQTDQRTSKFTTLVLMKYRFYRAKMSNADFDSPNQIAYQYELIAETILQKVLFKNEKRFSQDVGKGLHFPLSYHFSLLLTC